MPLVAPDVNVAAAKADHLGAALTSSAPVALDSLSSDIEALGVPIQAGLLIVTGPNNPGKSNQYPPLALWGTIPATYISVYTLISDSIAIGGIPLAITSLVLTGQFGNGQVEAAITTPLTNFATALTGFPTETISTITEAISIIQTLLADPPAPAAVSATVTPATTVSTPAALTPAATTTSKADSAATTGSITTGTTGTKTNGSHTTGNTTARTTTGTFGSITTGTFGSAGTTNKGSHITGSTTAGSQTADSTGSYIGKHRRGN